MAKKRGAGVNMAQMYDVGLKMLLNHASDVLPELIRSAFDAESFGSMEVVARLNVELNFAERGTADDVLKLGDGGLLHLELQANNNARVPVRMLDYFTQIFRDYKVVPHQLMLYVGRARMRMKTTIEARGWTYRYEALDMREVDGERLAASENWADNIIAILGRLNEPEQTARRVAKKVGLLKVEGLEGALEPLLRVASLSGLEKIVMEELREMPALANYLDSEVFAPIFRRGLKEGKRQNNERLYRQAFKKGELKGESKGELKSLRRQIQERFGAIPAWAEERLSTFSAAEREEALVRILRADDLEDLFNLRTVAGREL